MRPPATHLAVARMVLSNFQGRRPDEYAGQWEPGTTTPRKILDGMPSPPRITNSTLGLNPDYLKGHLGLYFPDDHVVYVAPAGLCSRTSQYREPRSEMYWATMYHELTHSTAHACGRALGHNREDPRRSVEELTASIGAAMLLGISGMLPVTVEYVMEDLGNRLRDISPDTTHHTRNKYDLHPDYYAALRDAVREATKAVLYIQRIGRWRRAWIRLCDYYYRLRFRIVEGRLK